MIQLFGCRRFGRGLRVAWTARPLARAQLSSSTVDTRRILDAWPGEFRLGINSVIRAISQESLYAAKAKERYIDERNWIKYISSFRRKLVKDPMAIFDHNEASLVEFCNMIDLIDDASLADLTPMAAAEVPLPQHLHDYSSLSRPELQALAKQRGIKANLASSEIIQKLESSPTPTPNRSSGPASLTNLGLVASDAHLEACKERLFGIMLQNAERDLSSAITAFHTLCSTSDLRIPHEWYPYARIMKRKVIYHGGPTNSGKTYHALKRLKEADVTHGGGLYAGPLRLLALEVYDSLNRQGVYTDLLTGQEQRQVPFSTHISSTLEMVNLTKEYDVAVIDEIQMIADDQRGYAWTRALQGLRAREIHVCGGLEAHTLVQRLVEAAGDEFELKRYERLSSLQINETSLRGDYSQIRPGDCIVAFSRADIFSIRRQVERLTPYKCAVIYGALPPETRSTQARLFNEDDTGYDVLVASDAIGMGLNLNIRRIVFHTTIKKGGGGAQPGAYWVDPSAIKQIAGRAGRMSSAYKIGEVTAWQEVDLAYIRAVMGWEIPQITSAGIFPSVDQVELFAEQLTKTIQGAIEGAAEGDAEGDADGQLPDMEGLPLPALAAAAPENTRDQTRLASLLERFVELAQMDGRYFLCEHDDMSTVANWLHSIPLSLADTFIFANAPVNTRDPLAMAMLYQFAATYAQLRPVALNVRLTRSRPRDLFEFADLCQKHNVLDLYLWLSFRFPKFFVERDLCLEQKAYAVGLIEKSLDTTLMQQKFSLADEYRKVNAVTALP